MIGGAAIIVRLGYFLVVKALAMAQSVCGYRGASLPQTVMAPREAARAVTASAALQTEPTPEAARWTALAGEAWPHSFFNRDRTDGGRAPLNDTTQPSYRDVRDALGLTPRQATWSAFSVCLLWHLVQPLVRRHDTAGVWVAFFQECQQHRCAQGYLLVLPFYFCNLDQDTSISDATAVSQGDLAIVVAVRELVYIVVCLLAACLCPCATPLLHKIDKR